MSAHGQGARPASIGRCLLPFFMFIVLAAPLASPASAQIAFMRGKILKTGKNLLMVKNSKTKKTVFMKIKKDSSFYPRRFPKKGDRVKLEYEKVKGVYQLLTVIYPDEVPKNSPRKRLGDGIFKSTGEVLKADRKRIVIREKDTGAVEEFKVIPRTKFLGGLVIMGDKVRYDFRPTMRGNLMLAVRTLKPTLKPIVEEEEEVVEEEPEDLTEEDTGASSVGMADVTPDEVPDVVPDVGTVGEGEEAPEEQVEEEPETSEEESAKPAAKKAREKTDLEVILSDVRWFTTGPKDPTMFSYSLQVVNHQNFAITVVLELVLKDLKETDLGVAQVEVHAAAKAVSKTAGIGKFDKRITSQGLLKSIRIKSIRRR